MIVIVIVIVLSRGYDRGADIRVSYARTGRLEDMVTGEYHTRDGTSRYMVTGEFHMPGFRHCVVCVYSYGRVSICLAARSVPFDSVLLSLCLIDVYDLMYIYMLSDVDMLL